MPYADRTVKALPPSQWLSEVRVEGAERLLKAKTNAALAEAQQNQSVRRTGVAGLSSRKNAVHNVANRGKKLVDTDGKQWDHSDFHSVRTNDKGGTCN